jgi:hypothetical protein
MNLKQWGYHKCKVSNMRLSTKTYELHEEPYLLPLERAELDALG